MNFFQAKKKQTTILLYHVIYNPLKFMSLQFEGVRKGRVVSA